MDQHRGDEPPPRRITINDRRKLHPQAAPSTQGDANLQAVASSGPPVDPAGPAAPAASTAPGETAVPAGPAAPAEEKLLESGVRTVRVPVIGDWLRFTYVENRGAAFGLLQDQTLFFVIVGVVVIGVIVYR